MRRYIAPVVYQDDAQLRKVCKTWLHCVGLE